MELTSFYSNVKIGCLVFETCNLYVEAHTATLQDTDFQFFSFFVVKNAKLVCVEADQFNSLIFNSE
jgi:hypothetical protein